MIQDMMLGSIADLFLTGTNFVPDDTFEGAIILLDLPTVNNATQRNAQILFKTVFQQAVLRRTNPKRPVFLYGDEYAEFCTPEDERFARMARSHLGAMVILNQDIGSLQSAFGTNSSAHELAKSFTRQFQTLIFHATNDVDGTTKWASDLVGDHLEITRSGNYSTSESETLTTNRFFKDDYSFGEMLDLVDRKTSYQTATSTKSKNKQTSESFGWQEQFRKELSPEKLLSLPRGNLKGTGVVGGYVVRTGEPFSTGKPFLYVEFSQRF